MLSCPHHQIVKDEALSPKCNLILCIAASFTRKLQAEWVATCLKTKTGCNTFPSRAGKQCC